MKEKKLEKAEMKESLLSGEALALNYVREVMEQVHEASKGGGNPPVEEPDLNMIKQEMVEKFGSERFEAWQQKMNGAGIP